MSDLFEMIRRLKEAGIHFSLDSVREEAIMVEVYVPGERWECEFFPDGHWDIEILRSDGEIHDKEKLEDLFDRYAD